MLDFFRKYQRYFFLIITVVVIFSFIFFGTYSTFVGAAEEQKDQIVGHALDGTPMMRSEVQKLSRLIATDREDSPPNFCNDGVIRYDFLKDRLADLLIAEYFDVLKGDFASRLDKAKRFRSYAHPNAPFLSAKAVWDHLLPALNGEIAALQAENEVTPVIFSHLAKLYQFQSHLHPDVLRRILIHQHQQYPWLSIDQRLSYEDLAIFGFHSASDWFGHHFVDLVAEFILNAAVAAERKGYQVSLEEAKGDLIHHFQESLQKLGTQARPDCNFHQHLRMLGLDEKSAFESWRKVLLFRRYFRDIGEAAFIDRLPYLDFAGYANEVATVQAYEWPIRIKNGPELAELEFYIKAVCPPAKGILPDTFLSVEEVERDFPQLVQSKYRANVAETTKKEVGLKATVKQVWEWQTDEKNWVKLRREFSLPNGITKEERFKVLETLEPKLRTQIDAWSRDHLVDENPAWIEEALATAPMNEKIWAVSGNEEPTLRAEGTFYRIENLEKLEGKHILLFNQAREILSKIISKKEESYSKEKNPFATASKEALKALQKNPTDPQWIQSGVDPLIDSFKLVRNEQTILRTSEENWMKEQAFMMLPNLWSPIYIADNGQIVFFYLQERKANQVPILDQLSLGKEMLAADAKAYATERLIQVIKKKQAIKIPIQREDEE